MRRREFIAGLSAPAWPMVAWGQQSGKIPKVGVLWHAGNEQEEAIYLGALRHGLVDLGYVDGKNIVLENRFPAEKPERFPVLAQELVALHPDVLLAVTGRAADAMQQATKTIPTLFIIYPIDLLLKGNIISSIAHPGGNITGLTVDAGDLTAKRIEVLRDAIGRLSRMALLFQPSRILEAQVKRCREVAADMNISLDEYGVEIPVDIDAAFASMAELKPDALYVPPASLTYNERARIAALALRQRVPTMCGSRELVDAGALLSYGVSYVSEFRRAGTYVDKILKGDKPADLPVEQPAKFELVVNLKTAKAIGVEIPPLFLSRADAMIE
jgi:putative tryptophan/tyrosine transport system substrate-binding protein